MKLRAPLLLLLAAAVLGGPVRSAPAEPIAFRQGDRVIMIGGVLAEREQDSGYVESVLAVNAAGLGVTFRNLGRGGDTVRGEARAGFEKVEVGYKRLIDEVREAKPTIILMFYGQTEAYAGEAGIKDFEAGYRKLLADLKEASGGARMVLFSPPPQERLRPPLPDPTEQNRNLAIYAASIATIADEAGARYVDLYRPLAKNLSSEGSRPLTENGIHFSEFGYDVLSHCIAAGLGLKHIDWEDGAVFEDPPPKRSPPEPCAQKLRRAIIKKNRIYFHRSRPENWTYLFGHRIQEQGRNAVEVPRFDPLVAEADKAIQALALDAAYQLGITPASEAK